VSFCVIIKIGKGVVNILYVTKPTNSILLSGFVLINETYLYNVIDKSRFFIYEWR